MALVIAAVNGIQATMSCTRICPEEMVVELSSGVKCDAAVQLCDCYYEKIPECFLSFLGDRWEMACAGGGAGEGWDGGEVDGVVYVGGSGGSVGTQKQGRKQRKPKAPPNKERKECQKYDLIQIVWDNYIARKIKTIFRIWYASA